MKVIQKYKWIIGIALFMVTYLGYTMVFAEEPDQSITQLVVEETVEPEEVSYIYVDIKGEVKHPGVYKLIAGSRIFQVISMAGGTNLEADIGALNLSEVLRDQDVVYVPNIAEEFIPIQEVIEQQENGIININTASLMQLETLSGIGPSTAQAIIDYREENGPFESIEDIMDVPGIGEATFNDIKDSITI